MSENKYDRSCSDEESEPGPLCPTPGRSGRAGRRSGVTIPVADRSSPGGSTADTEASLIEAAKTAPRRSSIIKDPSNQKPAGRKKTVSFSSMPSEKKISSAADCLSFMQGGCELKKVRPNSRVYSRFFTLEADLQCLRWEPSKKDPERARLDISAVREVRTGKNTETFRHNGIAEQLPEEAAFSIVHGEGYESLDLVAITADVANIWVTGLRYLLSHQNQNPEELEGGPANSIRAAWLSAEFCRSDEDGNGIMPEDIAVDCIRRLCPGIKETKVRLKFKELQRSKEKLTTRVTEEEFQEAYCELCTRPEVYFLLVQISKDKECLDAQDLRLFLEVEQGLPQVTPESCLDIINRFEPSEEGRSRGVLGVDGFTRYLLSPECAIFDPEHKCVCQDMSQPMSHYYVNASHRTYLIEDQLRGPVDVTGFVRALRMGCRCLELDVGDGPENEPVVGGRQNLSSPLALRSALEVINKYAFLSSDYPLLLCLGNRCSPHQQKVVAQHLKKVFGSKLYTHSSAAAAATGHLLSPDKLKRKVLLVGKKLPAEQESSEGEVTEEEEAGEEEEGGGGEVLGRRQAEEEYGVTVEPKLMKLRKELSDLIAVCKSRQRSYCSSPGRDHDFCRSNGGGGGMGWEVCSLGEVEAGRLANECLEELVNYNKRFLMRVRPSAMRVDSSNLNPQDFWKYGCQLVAMNYQTPGPMMDLHTGWFQQNGGCGFVLRPAVMREEVSYFSANTMGTVPGVPPQILRIKVISGQNFPKPRGACAKGDVIDPYVCVEIHGIPADCVEQRTRTATQNGDDPLFDESFDFQVNLPELALLRLVVLDDDCIGDEFIGQYTIPYECLQSGYRHVPLLSFSGEPVEHASLFVHVAITNRRGGGKAHKRGLSVRKGRRAREYTVLRNTGLKALDEVFRLAGTPLREATDTRENMQNATVCFKELCGLSLLSNLRQCILSLSSRLQSGEGPPGATLTVRDSYPYLEPQGNLPEATRKLLHSYDSMIQEHRLLLETADSIHERITQVQKAAMVFHEDLHRLGAKEGLKGRKLHKAVENFAWNITVLKGQGDLLRSAKAEALDSLKQLELACLSCGLSQPEEGGQKSVKEKESGEGNRRI
ncbi:inactive phospholipase C-like protein 1 [Polyodon spathula]|uniref:inactive phospholipase C-like protein 1 n=1 Tax=Polyodon spathula TaxID=7913 RepID=UPI001B7F4558|nr:inactive phospholipase C-like protein 1 [Polyodon spathula]